MKDCINERRSQDRRGLWTLFFGMNRFQVNALKQSRAQIDGSNCQIHV